MRSFLKLFAFPRSVFLTHFLSKLFRSKSVDPKQKYPAPKPGEVLAWTLTIGKDSNHRALRLVLNSLATIDTDGARRAPQAPHRARGSVPHVTNSIRRALPPLAECHPSRPQSPQHLNRCVMMDLHHSSCDITNVSTCFLSPRVFIRAAHSYFVDHLRC